MQNEHDILETFEITGRGVVAVIQEITGRSVGKPHKVEIVTPTGEVISTLAYKEWLLRRKPPPPVEKEVYLLLGLQKEDIPQGSRLRFLE